MTTGEIDDREPAHAQNRSVFDHHAVVIWPAVDDGLTHPANQIGGSRHLPLFSSYKPCYATHRSRSLTLNF
jgi:hypothetical protein